jgi:hypothetical protein
MPIRRAPPWLSQHTKEVGKAVEFDGKIFSDNYEIPGNA